MFQDISSKKKFFKIFQTDRKILTCHLVCCNFSKSQGGKIQILLELSYHSHLKKEGMTAAIVDHRRRGGRSKPYLMPKGVFLVCCISSNELKGVCQNSTEVWDAIPLYSHMCQKYVWFLWVHSYMCMWPGSGVTIVIIV